MIKKVNFVKKNARNVTFTSCHATRDDECICLSFKVIYNDFLAHKDFFVWGEHN